MTEDYCILERSAFTHATHVEAAEFMAVSAE